MKFNFKQGLLVAKEAAYQAGILLKRYWGKVAHIQEKEYAGDLVTIADKQSEEIILALLHEAFPTHQILAEESGLSSASSPFCWIIDPLDGTTNYTHQFPSFAISIALKYRNDICLGVVYNPLTNELFHAMKGEGAFLNDQPIFVSKTSTLQNSLLATGFAYDRRETNDNNYSQFCHLTNLTQGVRRMGAASLDLAYVACGRLDGYWEKGLKPWDMAAGVVIVEEAGGLVTDYQLNSLDLTSGRILATNGFLQVELSEALLSVSSSL